MRIAIDFDGVLHSYKQGFTGATDLPGAPVDGAREWIRKVLDAGHDVVVYSCRARTLAQASETEPNHTWDPGGEAAMREWLDRHGFPWMRVTGTKPAATVYIDDRALTFRGTWPSIRKLERFRPWEQDTALQGLLGGRARPQEILTPASITDCVREIFRGPIRLDPCAADDPRETVQAKIQYFGGDAAGDGLTQPWRHDTFVNPPFGELRKWLDKAVYEAAEGKRLVVLCPVRSRRPWWRVARTLALQIGAVVELNDVKFISYDAAFPEALCLLVFNVPASRVKASVTSRGIGGLL